MPIITISRASYSFGKKVAEKVAETLGYSCISREVLVETAAKNHITEQELFNALHNSPSFFENKKNREKYLNMIKATLIEHAIEDNLIYHGNAGHFLLPNISNLLKVRLVVNLDERVALLMKTKNLDETEARKEIEREDRQRAQWTHILYKQDLNSPYLYDLIIHIEKIDIDQASKIICDIVSSDRFKTTDKCIKKLKDEYILTSAKIKLFDEDVKELKVEDGILLINIGTPKIRKTTPVFPRLEKDIEQEIIDDIKISIYNKLKEIRYLKEIVFLS